MIDKPTRIGNSELYNVRVLNMSVARYYGVEKDYIQLITKAREVQKEELEKKKAANEEEKRRKKIEALIEEDNDSISEESFDRYDY